MDQSAQGQGCEGKFSAALLIVQVLIPNSCLLLRREIVVVLFRWHSQECEVTEAKKTIPSEVVIMECSRRTVIRRAERHGRIHPKWVGHRKPDCGQSKCRPTRH